MRITPCVKREEHLIYLKILLSGNTRRLLTVTEPLSRRPRLPRVAASTLDFPAVRLAPLRDAQQQRTVHIHVLATDLTASGVGAGVRHRLRRPENEGGSLGGVSGETLTNQYGNARR